MEETWKKVNEIWLPERLNAALKRRGINVELSSLRKFLSLSEKQVFAARPLYKGRIYAVDKDQRWAADILDLSLIHI